MDHPESTERGLAELITLKKWQLGDDVGTIHGLVWAGESYGTSRMPEGQRRCLALVPATHDTEPPE